MRHTLLIITACAAAGFSAEASQRAVMDSQLALRPVSKLLILSDSGVEVELDGSSIREFDSSELVGITQTDERSVSPPESAGWVELVDGQRFVGTPSDLASDDESLGWMHRDFGVLWIPFESVRRISPPGVNSGATLPEDLLSDVVFLINGDVLEGYIIGVGSEYEVETDTGDIASAPARRVSSAWFANPPEAPEGAYVWLADGSVVGADSIIDLNGERVQVRLRSGESAVLPTSQVLGTLFDAARVTALSSLDASVTVPEGRRWSDSPETDPAPTSDASPFFFARDVHIPGPMTLRWTLPTDATRVGMTLVMPSHAFPWGDCVVEIRSGGNVIHRASLNEESPRMRVNAPLSSPELEIEISEGEHGAVYDTVTLVAPMILRQAN